MNNEIIINNRLDGGDIGHHHSKPTYVRNLDYFDYHPEIDQDQTFFGHYGGHHTTNDNHNKFSYKH